MPDIVHHTSCPVCASYSIAYLLSAKDYTVTGEEFPIWKCSACTVLFTQDSPVVEDIGRYYQSQDYVSHTNTQQGLVNMIYHRVRKLTIESKQKLIEEATGLQKGALLDIGAGVGTFVAHMQNAGWNVRGLEPDPATRSRAKETYGVNLESSELLYSLPPQSYDAVTMWHVLEHVHDLHGYLEAIYHVLKPSGKLFIAVPNYESADARSYKQFWAAYDVPRHLYHFNPRSMKLLLDKHRLRVDELKPMWFDSVYVSLLSEKYKSGSQNILSGFVRGMLSNINALVNKKKSSSIIYIARKS